MIKLEEYGKMKKLLNEFKDFAIKGNMLEMAVGIIIGGAFTAVVTSIVSNLITPLIGIFIGIDFKSWEIPLPRLYGTAEPGVLQIGEFLNNLLSFFIVALTVFLFIKALNKFKKKQAEPQSVVEEPALTREEILLTEIRDILKDSKVEK